MDRAARRRQTKDVTRRTGTSSKDVQLVHPEPDTPVGKLQGFLGDAQSGREHRVETDTSAAARPVTAPTPETTAAPTEPGRSRAERRRQRFGSKPGVTGGQSQPTGGTPQTAVPRPAATSFRT